MAYQKLLESYFGRDPIVGDFIGLLSEWYPKKFFVS